MYKNRHMKVKWQHMTFKPDPISKIPHRQHTHLTLSFRVMKKKKPNNSYLMYYYKMKCMVFFHFEKNIECQVPMAYRKVCVCGARIID